MRLLSLVILFCTGCLFSNPVIAADGTWASAGSLGTGRYSHTSTLLSDRQVLVTGGFQTGNSALPYSELYDPTTAAWRPTGTLGTARAAHTASLLPYDQVLVTGGYGPSLAAQAYCELYDPPTGAWRPTGSLLTARTLHTATVLANGSVLVTGGINNVNASVSTCELYNPSSGTWSATGNLMTPRRSHKIIQLPNGKILAAGGYNNGLALATCEIYDPATGLWNSTGNLSQGRYDLTLSLLPTGQVLAVGGRDGTGNIFATCELFDANTGIWSSAGSLTIGRSRHTATTLVTGKVFVAGGTSIAGPEDSCAIYDPVDGQWHSAPSLPLSPRFFQSALLLPSTNSALITGGYSGSAPLTTSQLFTPALEPQTITGFTALSTRTYGDGPFAITGVAGGSSGQAVVFSSSNTNVATVSGTLVTITGAGSTTLTAQQNGNAAHLPATPVSQNLVVQQAAQNIIGFNAFATHTSDDAPFTITGVTGGGSGNPIVFTSYNTAVATIDGNTVTITGAGSAVITANQASSNNYSVAPFVSQTLTVIHINHLPTLGAILSSYNATEDTEFALPVSATDTDGDTLTFSFSGLPAWLNYYPAVGKLIGTPAPNFFGVEGPMTVSISDGTVTVSSQPFTITTQNVNDAPGLSSFSSNYDATEDTEFSLPVSAVDVDGDTLTFSFSGLPAWLNYYPAVSKLIGTPAPNLFGVEGPMTVSVSDGTVTVSSQPFTITTQNVNDAPGLSSFSSNYDATEDTEFSLPLSAVDVDGDTLTFSFSGLPAWLNYYPAVGKLIGTPAPNFFGVEGPIVVSVSDGTVTVSSQPFTITTQNVNDAPTISGTPTSSVNEDSLYSFAPTASDVDVGDVLTFSATGLPAWLSINTSTGVISGTPLNAHVGTTDAIVISVTDGHVSASLAPFTITVVNTNDAPVISGTVGSATEDSLFSFTPTVSDVDVGDVLTFSATGLPAWLSVNSATGELSGTPSNGDVGSAGPITLSVSDGTTSVNLPGSPTLSNFTNTALDYVAFNMTGVNLNYLRNGDLGTIATNTADANPAAIGYHFAQPQYIKKMRIYSRANADRIKDVRAEYSHNGSTWTKMPIIAAADSASLRNGDEAQFGNSDNWDTPILAGGVSAPYWRVYIYGVWAPGGDDNGGIMEMEMYGYSQEFFITVINTNDAPVISGTPASSVDENSLYSFAPTAGDVDAGDVLTFSATGLPAWLSINTSTGVISGTPAYADAGTTNTIIITVTDGYASTSLPPFTIAVSVTPVIEWNTPSPITYGTTLSAQHLNASTSVAGTMSYVPAANTLLDVGTHTLTAYFSPNDAVHYKATTTSITVTVDPATPAVTWPTPAPMTYGTTLSAQHLNASTSVAGTMSYIPAANTLLDVGTHTLTAYFSPSDAVHYTATTKSITVTVDPAAPILAWPNPAPMTYGTPLSATQLNATANVGGSFTYTPDLGIILPEGVTTIQVLFTPTDTLHYSTATLSRPVTVGHYQWMPIGTQASTPLHMTGMIAAEGGALASLGLTKSGSVVAWGYDGYGQLDVPTAAEHNVMAVAAGYYHAVALKTNGSVVAWGANNYGQTAVPASALNNIIAIAAGYGHTLALKNDGSVIAWGYNGYNQTSVPASAMSHVVAIAAGHYFSMALKDDGSVIAWGYNGSGQTVIPEAAQSGVVAIAAGNEHALAITNSGRVVAWGSNNAGQTSVPASALNAITAIAAGQYHSVALTQTGDIISWGNGETWTPPETAGKTVSIAAGNQHTLAVLNDGQLIAWGNNNYGQTTRPTFASSDTLVAIAPIFDSTLLGLTTAGTVVGWGNNSSGQLNIPAAAQSNITAMTAGAGHVLALTNSGRVVAWGYNGQEQTNVPAKALNDITAIAAGYYHSLALTKTGEVVAWGQSSYGAIDVPAEATSGVVGITAGSSFSAAITANGSVVVWGATSYALTQIPAAAQSNVVAIAAGEVHMLALRSDGRVVAWGNNSFGVTNVPLAAQSNVIAIAAGTYHAAALKNDGSLVTWGYNAYGQSTVPASIGSIVGVTGSCVTYGMNVVRVGQRLSATVTLNGSTVEYDGAVHGLTGQVANRIAPITSTLYNGSSAAPINTGSYSAEANINTWGYTGSAQATLTITPQSPSLSWTIPSALVYGTALSESQLNASAAIPGTFSYSPAAGAVLSAGTSTLTATFSPTDSINYLTASTNVSILVNQAPQAIIGFTSIPSHTYSDAPFTLAGITGGASGQPVIVTSDNPSVATVHNNTITITGVGTTNITAQQAGNINYLPALPVTQSLTISQASPTLTWTQPAAVYYGTALSAVQLNASASVDGSFSYTPDLGAILSTGIQTIGIIFTPNDTVHYRTASATTQLLVNQAEQIITGFTPFADHIYGDAPFEILGVAGGASGQPITFTSSNEAVATIHNNIVTITGAGTAIIVASQAGNSNYLPAVSVSSSLTILKSPQNMSIITPIADHTFGDAPFIVTGVAGGVSNQPVTFTSGNESVAIINNNTITITGAGSAIITAHQEGDANYLSSPSIPQTLTVHKATPSIAWTQPVSITYGTTLSNGQLNASATIAGTFTYTPPLGSLLSSGTHILRVSLTPNDTNNYEPVSAQTILVVNQALPVITWPTPTSITFGTALSSAQLNATANITGNFSYSPNAGTLLPVGTHALSAEFTPTDSGNYMLATASVSLVVLEALPTISVVASDATASETVSNTGLFTFTRTGNTGAALTVNFLVSGSAVSGTDYTAIGTSIVIPAGSTSVTKVITAINDTIAEMDETVVVTLTANSAYLLAPQTTATVTIADNEAPVISVIATDASAAEQGNDPGVLTVTRLGNKGVALTVNYSVTGSATAGVDCAAIGTTVTIPSGTQSVTKIITPVDDALVEDDETVILTLTTGTGYTPDVAAKIGTVTILDNELPVVTVAATDATASEPGTDTGAFTFTRAGRKAPALTINLTISGTAANSVDDVAVPATVNFAAGATTATIIVTPKDDTLLENDETVIVNVIAGSGYTVGTTNTATVKIIDNEKPLVSVTATDPNATEAAGNTGAFTITRVGSTNAALLVTFAMSGTAVSGSDYTALGTSIIIPAGANSVTKILTPVNDTTAELDEIATLSLTTNAAYTITSPSNASITITDDDTPLISLSATDTTAAETSSDPGVFTFTRAGNKNVAVTVNFTVTGTATAGADYAAIGTSVSIPVGATSATVRIIPVDDTAVEDDETAILTLASGAGYTVSTTTKTGTVTILENELPRITITAPDALASEPGTDKGLFTVTRIGRLAPALTINLSVTGSATSGSDYAALPTSVVINAGASSANVVLTPIDNTVAEPDETVVLFIAGGSGYTIGGPNTATITIADNDTPVLSVLTTDGTARETAADQGVFTITRIGNKATALTAKFILSGTATNGVDYTTLATTVSIPANSSTATVIVQPIDDAVVDFNESVVLNLVANTGYAVGSPPSAGLIITDNDDAVPPIVSALTPANNTTVTTARPVISATFADAGSGIATSSVRIWINGIDVTAQASLISATGFTLTHTANLSNDVQTVIVEVRDGAGNLQHTQWTFTVEAAPSGTG